MVEKLLAKGLKYGELTLEQHLIDTEKAALAIFKDRVLRNWCRFFKVRDSDRFLLHLRIAALFHDIGKANTDFQIAVQRNNGFKQALRHEWISAFILHLPTVREWLQSSKFDLDLEIITAAVLCHHLQASKSEWGNDRTGSPEKEIEIYLHHPEITIILTKINQIAELDGLPEFPQASQQWIKKNGNYPFWSEILVNANRMGGKFSREVKRPGNELRLGLLLAVKSGLIAADSVASAMFRVRDSEALENWKNENQKAIEKWLNQTLHQDPITEQEIDEKILQPRYQQIGITEDKLKDFQQKAIDLPSRLLLLSGCGSGKTIFAYKWQQGVVKQQQVGRVIFLYPTRGTATEGFKDYVSWSPEAEASLLTGTAAYEIQDMQQNPSESIKDKNFATDERLYTLGFWGKRFFSATVDQFLSFLTHNYSGMCLLPILADSVLVIDEIHSFSRKMFDNLISFLEHFDIPVLCMTATLPPSRQKEITEKLSQNQRLFIYPTVQDRSQLEDLKNTEERPRYIINSTNYDTAYSQAITSFQEGEGKRVLWVVNTVDRCRKIANKLEAELKVEVLTYHSRFLLKDRKERHKETVAAFQGDKKLAIAVTTQVCEMSLDLDADVLITELAPISSLVQRFGRCNRSSNRKSEERGYIWVYEPHNDQNPEKIAYAPYDEKEIISAQGFLGEVLGEVSQYQLAKKLQEHARKERNADQDSPFVNGGYWATSEPFREDDDYSVSAVLDGEYLIKFLELRKEKDPEAEGYTISVPKRYANFNSEDRPPDLPKYLGIAKSKFYCSKRGFGE